MFDLRERFVPFKSPLKGTPAEWFQGGAEPTVSKRDFRKDHAMLCKLIRRKKRMAALMRHED
jgi:hypothetical protein